MKVSKIPFGVNVVYTDEGVLVVERVLGSCDEVAVVNGVEPSGAGQLVPSTIWSSSQALWWETWL